jgi:phospholipase A1
MIRAVVLLAGLLISFHAFGNTKSEYDTCILEKVANATPDASISEVRGQCSEFGPVQLNTDILSTRRIEEQRAAATSRRALIPHERNYLIPVAYSPDPQERPVPPAFRQFFPDEAIDNVEMKFQLSLKYEFANSVLMRNDRMHFGFTSLSFWQAYNSDVSAPFRETNYEPEIFWTAPSDWQPLGIGTSEFSIGFSHESNGQAGTLSRSWNRIYADMTWTKGNYVFNFKPWYRIREDRKEDLLDAEGDDNRDIEGFLGHFEFTSTYRRENHEISLMLRNNLRSENRGAVQLDWTFPIWRDLKGHAQYFNGYGESLIDYNRNVERIGFGLILSDLY